MASPDAYCAPIDERLWARSPAFYIEPHHSANQPVAQCRQSAPHNGQRLAVGSVGLCPWPAAGNREPPPRASRPASINGAAVGRLRPTHDLVSHLPAPRCRRPAESTTARSSGAARLGNCGLPPPSFPDHLRHPTLEITRLRVGNGCYNFTAFSMPNQLSIRAKISNSRGLICWV